jgi:two-component system alkaline phosphatase synthesis response regulator PhoP
MQKILAIDDESSCLEIIEFSLTSRGYEVFSVSSGTKAVDFLLANEHKIDLILLDMMMPEMDGTQTLKKIRSIESARDIPVIFQTGTSSHEPIGNLEEKSELEYIIRKPYKRDELLNMIKTALCVMV